MDTWENIKFTDKELKNIPLHFRKIYFNQITYLRDEYKMFKYDSLLQCNLMRGYFPKRQISKTIDFKTFNDDE
nr:hypothetical protein BACY1_00310 [Tenacibaculum mesophilum]